VTGGPVARRGEETAELLCPSAAAEPGRGVIFGVAGATGAAGSVGGPPARAVAYLTRPVPVPDDVAEMTAPARPNEVLRTASPCAQHACSHFSGSSCTLIERITAALEPAVARPPACAIRATCRWWAEQGRNACVRCPQVVTDRTAPSEAYARAMAPPGEAAIAI
jgi:hypothetical protein